MENKIKLNKSELTKLKKEEKIYLQFLPVLKLKQEQLQIENIKIKKNIKNKKIELELEEIKIKEIMKLLNDNSINFDIKEIFKIKNIIINEKSIAGIKLPFIERIDFTEKEIFFYDNPIYIIENIETIKIIIKTFKEIEILNKQNELLNKELKKTIQRINLFEKILIPKNKEETKKIKIALSDEQVSSVGRGKIAKKKTK